MCRRGRLELILVLPDGSTLLVPAEWTDLQPTGVPAEAGTLASLADLFAARRVVDGLFRTAVSEEDGR